MQLYLREDLKPHFSHTAPLFDQIMALQGEVFRHQDGRLTQRIRLGNQSYFIKQHHGVGWREILKNLLQLRAPIISAKNEWQAITELQVKGVHVPVIVAYGERGFNPAKRQSFVLMEDLTATISLEDYSGAWASHPPSFKEKKILIEKVAQIARSLHQQGMNHRDFYLCHFLLDQTVKTAPLEQVKLYLIDLHRTQIRRLTPMRWIIKDLAGLLFSCHGIGLTQRDLYRFMQHYRQLRLRDILCMETHFWKKVKTRGDTYRDHTQ